MASSATNADAKNTQSPAAETGGGKNRSIAFTKHPKIEPLRAFYHGLTRPSGLSIVIAVAMAASAISFGASVIDEAWVIQNSQILGDRTTYQRDLVTRRALQLHTAATDLPTVILVGCGHHEQDLNALDPAGSKDHAAPEIYDLRTSSQSIWETLAICDQIPRESTGKLVLYLSPESLAAGTEEAVQLDRTPSYGFRSASLSVELQRLGKSSVPIRNVYFLDNHSYLIRRLPTALLKSLTQYNIFANQAVNSENHPVPAEDLSPQNSASAEDLAQNLRILEYMLERLQDSRLLDVSIVFDADRSLDANDLAPEVPPEARQLLEEVRALAERQQIELMESVAPQA